jgi:hypothetical protein
MNIRALRLSLPRSAYHREPLLASIGEVGVIWPLGSVWMNDRTANLFYIEHRPLYKKKVKGFGAK